MRPQTNKPTRLLEEPGWPLLRLARLRCERGSVGVVSPAGPMWRAFSERPGRRAPDRHGAAGAERRVAEGCSCGNIALVVRALCWSSLPFAAGATWTRSSRARKPCTHYPS